MVPVFTTSWVVGYLSIGKLFRLIVGPKMMGVIGPYYRSLFINLEIVVGYIESSIPQGATVLDVGCGDGYLIDMLLVRRPDLKVIMMDSADNIAGAISQANRGKITIYQKMDVAEYFRRGYPAADIILLCDVLHHVPKNERDVFLRSIGDMMSSGSSQLLIKEFAPQGVRGLLGFISDRFISGDRNVAFLTPEEVIGLVERNIGTKGFEQTPLMEVDSPNYLLKFDSP